MLKTFKFRIYPTKDQIVKLSMHFGYVRFMYNYFLDYSQEQYKAGIQACGDLVRPVVMKAKVNETGSPQLKLRVVRS